MDVIKSMLNEDLYKFSMQKAICHLYPTVLAKYKFFNRGKTEFPEGFAISLREQIHLLSTIKLSQEEKDFLRRKCYFFDPVYLDFLAGYQYNPDEVSVFQSGSHLEINIEGPWYRTVLWEVKLMAIISELYYQLTKNYPMTEEHLLSPGQIIERAACKGADICKAKIKVSDFGTRRRFSYNVQDKVVQTLSACAKNYFVGTSNVGLAMKYDLTPIGTEAHEFISGVGALKGLEHANQYAMEDWIEVYSGNLGIALADTFGTNAFLKDFTSKYARLFQGVRHDSGDPIVFGEKIIDHYHKNRIDPLSKTIIFSDGLVIPEAIRIAQHFSNKISVSFGIGTSLTNDCGAKPLNMVIKLIEINGHPAIKLSDVPGKETGDSKTIEYAKWLFNQ